MIRPDQVEEAVFTAMRNRLDDLVIAKRESEKPNAANEAMRADILRLDDEIRKLLDKLAEADDILFEYIQKRVSELHVKKSELEGKLRAQSRRHKEIDAKSLEDPMKVWDSLSNAEKHALATTMIDVVYVSDENGIDIQFGI